MAFQLFAYLVGELTQPRAEFQEIHLNQGLMMEMLRALMIPNKLHPDAPLPQFQISCQSESDLLILVIDTFCTPMIDVANELGIPYYLFFPSSASYLGLLLHLPTLNQQITTEFYDSGTEYKETKGIILNTFQELEPWALNSFLGTDVPPVYSVGPLVDNYGLNRLDSDRAQEDKVLNWLDHQPQSSVVFFYFGSLGGIRGAQLREIATGLERTEQRFLLSLRQPEAFESRDYTDLDEVLPNGFLERTAETGLICWWVPHMAILAHKAIGGLVSYYGWNSFIESLWYGVPIATWPIFGQ
ncbi:UDP-glycosyltransferase 71K1-like [Cornus florida]|uniref:UDP-glycosyltransferase 71K1-like n=1 Tax=Cornus florida TaxID=4283 RepID=UPI00289B5A8A|nr:UDP-glycosyltransferase 71K1-like [Cornus florida]